jgi:lysine-ketoglutarate reductase/saccharopine dehydrogenase-like protein (TIGR00300 family)
MADRDVAQKQWDELHNILSKRTQVETVAPLPELPDMCFVANAGLVLDDVFVPSNFRVQQRAPEIPGYSRWFTERNYQIKTLSEDCEFEGEGDALFHPNGDKEPILWAGYGCRSNLLSYTQLTEMFRCQILPLRLMDKRFYHLDTCFTPLPDGRVMYYPAAFDLRSLRLIRETISENNRLEVSDQDALGFCCNAVRLGNTLVMNHASSELRQQLHAWDYEVIVTPLSEFLLAGGAAKCLSLQLQQETAKDIDARDVPRVSIRTTRVELSGDLLDSGVMNRALDTIDDAGGSFRVEQFSAGLRHDQPSIGHIRVSAPDQNALNELLNQLQVLGAKKLDATRNAELVEAPADGIAPETFYSTTVYPTEVHVADQWVKVSGQRMDVVIVVENNDGIWAARCCLMRNLKQGDKVVCGVDGVSVRTPERNRSGDFEFMAAGVSSERRVERIVEELAWEMRRIRARGGKIAMVAGPVVIHTGGSEHLTALINAGYIQSLLTGNALPVHDMELNLFGTSLGVDMKRGVGVPHGHQHHLRTINRVCAAGSIRAAVEQGIITGGIMYACVKNNVEYVLAGSIRDDGPLPDTEMDLIKAQAEYAKAIEGAEMILMLSSMLHAIGTGNMTPAGVRLICVDINPAVVTKLADRGSVESTGIVTDVGLFLSLLRQRLAD